jgi:hypothetical protein
MWEGLPVYVIDDSMFFKKGEEFCFYMAAKYIIHSLVHRWLQEPPFLADGEQFLQCVYFVVGYTPLLSRSKLVLLVHIYTQ